MNTLSIASLMANGIIARVLIFVKSFVPSLEPLAPAGIGGARRASGFRSVAALRAVALLSPELESGMARSMRTSLMALALMLIVGVERSASAACFDLSKSEPHVLTGILSYRVFPGPPGYQDVRRGDSPEPGYLLTLPQPICLTGDEFADPATPFSEAQLVETDKTANAMRSLLNTNVTVTLSSVMAGETGHHHRPLVAWVSEISPAHEAANEDGISADAVRAFYHALAGGDGRHAEKLIVPERRSGPFSGPQMSRFYGALAEPLELLSLKAINNDSYFVRYKFRSNAGPCNGRAIVNTVNRSGSIFIESIRALDGC